MRIIKIKYLMVKFFNWMLEEKEVNDFGLFSLFFIVIFTSILIMFNNIYEVSKQ